MARLPEKYRTADVAELGNVLRTRDGSIKTLSARVDITVTSGGLLTGKKTTIGAFSQAISACDCRCHGQDCALWTW